MYKTRILKNTFQRAGIILFSAAICLVLIAPLGRGGRARAADIDGRIYDRSRTVSFVPPAGWAAWNYWGRPAFSPTSDHKQRIIFTVIKNGGKQSRDADSIMKIYTTSFSTENYILISKEYLYAFGFSGIRILAQGTARNILYGTDYLWVQEYVTPDYRIQLIFRSSPDSFEANRKAVLESFRSLIIAVPAEKRE